MSQQCYVEEDITQLQHFGYFYDDNDLNFV